MRYAKILHYYNMYKFFSVSFGSFGLNFQYVLVQNESDSYQAGLAVAWNLHVVQADT